MGSNKYGDQASSSIMGREFEKSRDDQLLRETYAPFSYFDTVLQ
jgi:hypothetical protein